jgi:hypothetical protein
VTVLRPKGGWIRQQFRYLVPAAAAAALVVMVVRYGGMHPGASTSTAMGWPSAGAGRDATGSIAPADGHGWPSAGAGRDATGSIAPADGHGCPGF